MNKKKLLYYIRDNYNLFVVINCVVNEINLFDILDHNGEKREKESIEKMVKKHIEYLIEENIIRKDEQENSILFEDVILYLARPKGYHIYNETIILQNELEKYFSNVKLISDLKIKSESSFKEKIVKGALKNE